MLGIGTVAAQTPVPVWAGQQSSVKAFAVAVVRDEDAWGALWSSLRREAAPPFHTGQHIGVVIYLGQRNTGGFALEIGGAKREGALTIVSFRTIEPDSQAFLLQVLTTPYILARIEDDGTPVAFRRAGGGGDQPLILPPSEVDRLNALIDHLRGAAAGD
jgi:hypothetical protein